MKNRNNALAVVMTVVGILAVPAGAASQAVIIQGWTPYEAAHVGWAPEGPDTLNELWNDCFLVYEMLYNRNAIGGDTSRIHMLWGKGSDYPDQGERYDPARLRVDSITDDSASIATVDSVFRVLGELIGPDESLFCYTWGHGGNNNSLAPSRATHVSILVRPITRSGGRYHGVHLWDTAFARMARPIDGRRAFIMQQCRGGGFVDDLGDDRTVIVCATAAGKLAETADGKRRMDSPLPEHETLQVYNSIWRHSEFNFHFLNALRGRAIFPYDSPPGVNADRNGNGYVEWDEAFGYVDSHETTLDEPVYYQPGMVWSPRTSIPAGDTARPVDKGAGLAAVAVEDTLGNTSYAIYALKGYFKRTKASEFWSYSDPEDPDADWWVRMQDLPLGESDKTVKDGGELTSDGTRYVYALKGNKTREFWRFDAHSGKWDPLTGVPQGANSEIKRGSSLVYAEGSEGEKYIFCLKGGKRGSSRPFEFWRYSVGSQTWDEQSAPRNLVKHFKWGSALAWDGGDYVYAMAGQVSGKKDNCNFVRYRILDGQWESLPSLPAKPYHGGALCYSYVDQSVYAFQGGKSQAFWRFDTRDKTWSSMPDMPLAGSNKKVRHGGSLAYASGLIYALKGNKTYEFWRYVVPTDTGVPGSPPPDPQEYPRGGTPVVDIDGDNPQWSPSGRLVAFSRLDQASGFIRIYTKDIPSGVEACITPGVEADCGYPQWHPDGLAVVFEMCDHTSYVSQIASADLGGNVTQWTSTAVDRECPRFTPDPYLVIYQREDEEGAVQLYSIDGPGRPEVQLSDGQTDRENPYPYKACVWENGAQVIGVVYEREDEEGYTQVHRMVMTSNGVVVNDRQLTQGPPDKTNPCPYSDPASGIDFVVCELEDDEGTTSICKVPGVPPHVSTVLLTDAATDLLAPAVSANGLWACLERWKGNGTEIVEVATDGSGLVYALTDDDLLREGPQYSITGTIVVSCEVPMGGRGRSGRQAGRAETPGQTCVIPALVRNVLPLASSEPGSLHDITGRRVMDLQPGPNDIVHLAPGVYFVRIAESGTRSAVRKIVIQR